MNSTDKDDAPVGKKAKGMVTTVLLGVAMLCVGAGGAYATIASGILGGHDVRGDNRPQLIRKDEKDPFAPKTEGDKEGVSTDVHGDGGSEYRTAYYSFSDEFTSNLKDSDALLQVSLACSTRRDGRVLMWIREHELAIRSAMLGVLADTPENEVYTIEGKERLQKRLTAAINRVLLQTEGFGGVDAVYFKSLLIQ